MKQIIGAMIDALVKNKTIIGLKCMSEIPVAIFHQS